MSFPLLFFFPQEEKKKNIIHRQTTPLFIIWSQTPPIYAQIYSHNVVNFGRIKHQIIYTNKYETTQKMIYICIEIGSLSHLTPQICPPAGRSPPSASACKTPWPSQHTDESRARLRGISNRIIITGEIYQMFDIIMGI